MSPQLQFESASMLTFYSSLLCHNDPSIISRESMHKHNFGQALKLQGAVGTVNIRSRSLKIINSFLSPNNVSMQVWCRKPPWFRRQSSKKAEFTVFKDDDLEKR